MGSEAKLLLMSDESVDLKLNKVYIFMNWSSKVYIFLILFHALYDVCIYVYKYI